MGDGSPQLLPVPRIRMDIIVELLLILSHIMETSAHGHDLRQSAPLSLFLTEKDGLIRMLRHGFLPV